MPDVNFFLSKDRFIFDSPISNMNICHFMRIKLIIFSIIYTGRMWGEAKINMNKLCVFCEVLGICARK